MSKRSEGKKRQIERITGEMSTVLLFVPQCAECSHNISFDKCGIFKSKPIEYMNNDKKCPYKQPVGSLPQKK